MKIQLQWVVTPEKQTNKQHSNNCTFTGTQTVGSTATSFPLNSENIVSFYNNIAFKFQQLS